ncbi:MAG: thioredoxin domain-containing protein [Planctomycetes bacterium]|nr:thioredoxin domain-containing protein [Planctomycetota bacterium]
MPKQKPKHDRKPTASEPESPSPSPLSALFYVGCVLLAIAAVASGALVLQSVGSINLPGCGFESDCARAAKSAWGRLGFTWLTTANVGLAYFLAVLVAWVVSRGTLGTGLRWVVRVGAIVSVLLPIVMFANGYVCNYCLGVHGANLVFVIMLEGLVTGGRKQRGPVVPFASVLAIALFSLTIVQWQHERRVEAHDEKELEKSTKEIIDRPGTPDVNSPIEGPFAGRYRVGPEEAPIRIVIISDYQCPDCKNIENQVRQILADRTDVSFSAKQFPFCTDCNPKAHKNLHPNACWAARAAEAAGMIGGEEGFWRMHHWLFDQGGSFTDANFPASLQELGFEPQQFIRTMSSPETLALVSSDIDEAISLGLRQTPMIFVNGVQLFGWRSPNALVRTVDEVAATNPPALTADVDRPPAALEKYVEEWRAQFTRQLPPDQNDWTWGPANAAARVMVWGDYQEPYTAQLDARIRAVVEARDDVSYSFRHYPIDQSCNSSASRTMHPFACRGSQAAEAAGRLGGREVYWKMHTWLMENQVPLDDAKISEGARAVGLDPAALLKEMQSPEVAAAIQEDGAAAKRQGLRGVPFAFVNSKNVVYWSLAGEPLPERIIEEAAAGR